MTRNLIALSLVTSMVALVLTTANAKPTNSKSGRGWMQRSGNVETLPVTIPLQSERPKKDGGGGTPRPKPTPGPKD